MSELRGSLSFQGGGYRERVSGDDACHFVLVWGNTVTLQFKAVGQALQEGHSFGVSLTLGSPIFRPTPGLGLPQIGMHQWCTF